MAAYGIWLAFSAIMYLLEAKGMRGKAAWASFTVLMYSLVYSPCLSFSCCIESQDCQYPPLSFSFKQNTLFTPHSFCNLEFCGPVFFCERCMQRVFSMNQISIKTPNPECRLYWCLIEFIDWRYNQSSWYFQLALPL